MKKNIGLIAAGIVVLAAIGVFAYYKFYIDKGAGTSDTTQTTESAATSAVLALSDSELIDIMISLEDDLGMKEVLAAQYEDILEVKFSAPTIGGDELDRALVQIFGYIDGKLPKSITKIRLVFVVNYIDSATVELERNKISDWKAEKLDNAGLIKAFVKESFVPEPMTAAYFPFAYAQSEEDPCPVAHSHQEGDLCVCDTFYKAEGGQCVPMSPSEICPIPHSHQDGSNCVCDQYYKPEGGQCVPMTELEMCGQEHAHRVGDKCVCDEGYAGANGQCVNAAAYCASHNATFDTSINDCRCNEGYVENADGTDCIPVTKEEQKSEETTALQVETTQPETETSTAATAVIEKPESAPSLSTDPVQILLDLNNDSKTKFTIDPITSNLTPDEKSYAELQITAINDFKSRDEGEIQLDATSEEKLNMIRSAIVGDVFKDTQKWQVEVETAEKESRFKSESDKELYKSLMYSIEAQEELYKANVEALNVMHKQNITYILDESPASKVMWAGDKKFENAPKRDFLKEAQGDPTMASVYATEAAAAQYKLLGEIKDEIRRLRQQKAQYLDVRPKPDLKTELQKLDLYK
ncbi:hypothetical protein JW911_03695 [Candidatus Peregrinibacteria bacterium]|nr:hypothetical protein [Candidatus Peregrinibacteria bacterium]